MANKKRSGNDARKIAGYVAGSGESGAAIRARGGGSGTRAGGTSMPISSAKKASRSATQARR